MNILIASAIDAYDRREETALAEAIQRIAKDGGHTIDSIYLPYERDLLAVHGQLLSYRLLSVDNVPLLITVGYPAFALRHPNKYSFLFQLTPQFHEQWDTQYGVMRQWPRESAFDRLRSAVLHAERACLAEAQTVYAASDAMIGTLQSDLGQSAKKFAFATPVANTDEPLPEAPYLVSESCLNAYDRVDLLLAAMDSLSEDIPLLLYIPQADALYKKALHDRIRRLSIERRVIVREGYAPIEILRGSSAVLCTGRRLTRIPSFAQQAAAIGVPCIALTDSNLREELPCLCTAAEAASLAACMIDAVKKKAVPDASFAMKNPAMDLYEVIRELVGS